MLEDALLIVLYISLIIFVISMTVLVIKLITTVNKTNYLVENLTKKAESLDNLFNVIDFTTNKFNQVGELIVGSLTGLVKKIFGSKEREEEDYE
ncbi:MAG TPA: hypothetical protein DD613_05195 [Firmicutes bacterium]|jgi:uncharacterized protein YoxC|nr:hypothetical protein [Bacillota bacterium]